MQIEILNKNTDKQSLNDKVWKSEYNKDLVSQVLYAYFSNQRKGCAKAKNRAEVSGGGIKPWKQKGTGRARQGSIRSPLWVKGGVTFGPTTERNWTRKINKKMNRIALKGVLSNRVQNGSVKFVDFSGLDNKKARNIIIDSVSAKSTVVLTDNDKVSKAVQNIPYVDVAKTANVNVYNLTKSENLIVDVDSVTNLEKLFVNE